MIRHELMERAPWLMGDAVRSAMTNLTRPSAAQIARELWRKSPSDLEFITKNKVDEYFADVTLDAMHRPMDGPMWEMEALADYQFSLDSIDCPVLIVQGEQDALTDNDAITALFGRHGNVAVHRYPDAGHLCFISEWADILIRTCRLSAAHNANDE
ncbi:MAG: hypothetical protein AAFW68_07445 [Pseudomonadota bacterium]